MADSGRPVRAPQALVGAELAHDSAAKHVSGRALYVDDLPEPPGLLHVQFGLSARAHARIASLDLSAVRAAPGVVCVLTAADVPGTNDVSPQAGDDPLFADGVAHYLGQSLFAVAAETRQEARAAVRLAKVEYADLPAALTIGEAMARERAIEPVQTLARGDAPGALARAAHRVAGSLATGGQDHFYLEGQIAMAVPGEDGDMLVHASSQHPSEVQHIVARVLGMASHAVTVEVRRMGGGFGGKETQPALIAAAAALAAARTGRPAKLRLDRDDDMILTGKRHDFEIAYEAGFDDDGRLEAFDVTLKSRCGHSADLSKAVNDRAMTHADNAYFLPHVRIVSHRLRTNTVSNTAFRGFGGPQGMMGIERAIDAVAFALGKDPLDVRLVNLYGGEGRDVTPYGQRVEDNVAPELIAQLAEQACYRPRRAAIRAWNAGGATLKRGIALTPVKFGISFTATHFNQAGALIHLYTDGSIQLNHGGTEMGQGLLVKVAQVVAQEFGVGLERIKVMTTSTGKVPNTSATAASAGSDLNGMAAHDAARTLTGRLAAFAAAHYGGASEDVRFAAGGVDVGGKTIDLAELVQAAYRARVQLSATGFYKTPKIGYDPATRQGRPFFYYAYGAAVSEVAIDTLTGESRVLRADILHDCGRSLNPAIDRGQIEGGYVQGMGWLTTEELWFDEKGALKTHAPSTYKIPVASDRPAILNIDFFARDNEEETIHRSKAVGEPPLMLAISVFSALTDAVAAAGGYAKFPALDAPATPERILRAVESVR